MMLSKKQERRLDELLDKLPKTPTGGVVPPPKGSKWSAVEDEILKIFVGKKTADDISALLGRSRNGVHNRVRILKLDGVIRGQDHWAAQFKDVQVAMIRALHDAGFAPHEIHKQCFPNLNYNAVLDIINSYTRRER